ncbi:hypothetical protein TNCV_184741 [Trichonephila clavipes]|nr:hypothetical protein TNCV_184741 [Trichonephila clavipes]
MFDSSSYANPTLLAHADTSRDAFPRGGMLDVKGASRTGRPVVESVDTITEIIEVDRHISSRSITQELKNDHKKQF